MSPVGFKKTPCHPVDLKGRAPIMTVTVCHRLLNLSEVSKVWRSYVHIYPDRSMLSS